jgi:hypothetical protein
MMVLSGSDGRNAKERNVIVSSNTYVACSNTDEVSSKEAHNPHGEGKTKNIIKLKCKE